MLHRITDKITPWMDQAIDAHGHGEPIEWESALMPNQNGEPTLTVFVWFPGAVLGTVLNGSFQVHDVLHLEAKDIDDIMAAFLPQLREARAGTVTPEGAPGPAAPPHRGQQTASGLILP